MLAHILPVSINIYQPVSSTQSYETSNLEMMNIYGYHEVK